MEYIKSTTEFTWFILEKLPRAFYLSKQGIDVTVQAQKEYKDFAYFCEFDELDIKTNFHIKEGAGVNIYESKPPEYQKRWLPPKLKDRFQNKEFLYEKPCLIINNKYIPEWGGGPAIYFDVDELDYIIEKYQDSYQIIYIRATEHESGYHADESHQILDFGDFDLLRQNPNVIIFNDLLSTSNYSYNELQCKVMANADFHFAAAGGNACLSAYFAKTLVIKNCLDCNSKNRKIWHTDSWLSELNNSQIFGIKTLSELKNLYEHRQI